MSPKQIDSFKEIVELYDLFIFDIYGVLHNGIELYSDTIKFIEKLRQLKKQIAILSNSPRPNSFSLSNLNSKGFEIENNEHIATSGDFFRYCYTHDKDEMFKDRTLFNLGGEQNHDLLANLDVSYAPTIEESDYVIISAFIDDSKDLGLLDQDLNNALEADTIMLCVNPDIVAPQGDQLRYTPGYFAKKYLEMGGSVYYYGKPFAPIYSYLFDEILKIHPKSVKSIMIGDSVGTDILGACNFGIDSLLLKNGVHAQINDETQFEKIYEEFGATPTFAMDKPNF